MPLLNNMLYNLNCALFGSVSGTSASSPVVAGMVSLVNAERRAAGNSTLGWLNPVLYSLYPAFVNDITSGDNKCLSAGHSCCDQGFYATVGWDPASGLGSIDFDKFRKTLTGSKAATPVETSPTASVQDQTWLLSEGYARSGCSSAEKVVAQTGFPVGRCLVSYASDNDTQPVSSLRYTCDTELGKKEETTDSTVFSHPCILHTLLSLLTTGFAATWHFSDLRCTLANFTHYEQQQLGCSDLTAGNIVGSVNTLCVAASGTNLPLPTGKHIVER